MCNRCNCAPRYAHMSIPKNYSNPAGYILRTYPYSLTFSERAFLCDVAGYTFLSYLQRKSVESIRRNAARRAAYWGH